MKKRVKPGTNKTAAAVRKEKFIAAYIANGGNKRAAAIAAGYKPGRAADKAGERLSHDVAVIAAIEESKEKVAQITGLELERTLREVARLAYADPRRLFESNGKMIAVTSLPEDVAATVASIETDEKGIKKIKLWDKNAALEKAMKFHGLYEKDNRQRGESLVLRVAFGREDDGR